MIRQAAAADFDALGAVFHAAVREGPGPYSAAQRAAWSPARRSGPQWAARLAGQHVVLAEEDGSVAGFMSLRPDGYVDMAFILAEARGRGLFGALCREVEARARALGLARLTTHASLMAEPAFRRYGFRVIQHETVLRSGESLARAEMEKELR